MHPRAFGLLASVNGLAVISLTTVVLHFTRRLPPLLTVALAGLFFAAGFGLVGLAGSLPLLLLSTLVWTMGEILEATSTGAYIAGRSPMTHRGRINAIAPIIMYSGFAAGPPLAGRLIERFSLAVIWPGAFALSLAAALLLALLYVRERSAGQGQPGGG